MTEQQELLINTIGKNLSNVVQGAGYAQLNVRSIGEDTITDPDKPRTIISLSGCTNYQKSEIIKALKSKKSIDEFTEDELQDIANMNATYSFPSDWLLRANKPFVPESGDAVKALFNFKFSENQGVEILVVDRLREVGAAKSASFSIEDIFSGKIEDVEEEKSEASKLADEVIK